MAKCYDCKKESELESRTASRPDGEGKLTIGSYAICPEWAKKEDSKHVK